MDLDLEAGGSFSSVGQLGVSYLGTSYSESRAISDRGANGEPLKVRNIWHIWKLMKKRHHGPRSPLIVIYMWSVYCLLLFSVVENTSSTHLRHLAWSRYRCWLLLKVVEKTSSRPPVAFGYYICGASLEYCCSVLLETRHQHTFGTLIGRGIVVDWCWKLLNKRPHAPRSLLGIRCVERLLLIVV